MGEVHKNPIDQLVQLFGRTVRCRIIGELLESGPKCLSGFQFRKQFYQVSDRKKLYSVKNRPTTIHRHLIDMERDGFVSRQRNGNTDYWSLNPKHPLIFDLLTLNDPISKAKSITKYTSKDKYETLFLSFFNDIGENNPFKTSDLREHLEKHDQKPSSARLSQLLRDCDLTSDNKNFLNKHGLCVEKIAQGTFKFRWTTELRISVDAEGRVEG